MEPNVRVNFIRSQRGGGGGGAGGGWDLLSPIHALNIILFVYKAL